jgi:uncharacterized protein YjbJ (UPF0337 family)
MNEDEIKGKAENLKGRLKDAAGALTGNKKTQAEGMADRAKGAIREKVGQIKREVSRDAAVEESDDE